MHLKNLSDEIEDLREEVKELKRERKEREEKPARPSGGEKLDGLENDGLIRRSDGSFHRSTGKRGITTLR